MTNNGYDYEAAKLLIDDETNITETNLLKDLFQISVKIVLVLASIYLTIFVLSGVIIQSLPLKNQIVLENVLSSIIKIPEKDIINDTQHEKEIRDKILRIDKKFPRTSNLEIKILKDKQLNALCYPNGNIYITSALAKHLQNDDEMLTFVIAHEMAHYRNKDHLMNLRKNIAAASVIIFTSVFSGGNQQHSDMVGTIINLSDLKYSRSVEAKADKYASLVLLKLYGTTDGGVRTMKVLDEGLYREMEIFSTHPDIQKRIDNIKKIEKSIKFKNQI